MTASNKCILVVDNVAEVLDSVKYNLSRAGYTVVTADNAEGARELLARTIIHLAVVDIRLNHDGRPDDRSGFDVVRELPPYIPTVVFTAYD
jgi:DNA-binding NtrC family response regulator